MKKTPFLILFLLILSCSKSDENTFDLAKESSICLEKNFMESFDIEPNDCFVFSENTDMTFTFLGFEAYTKYGVNNIPHAKISARLAEENFVFEFYTGMIYEDNELEGTSFSGKINTGINNVEYTIFFDNIKFTETETQFIFHKATIRFGYSD